MSFPVSAHAGCGTPEEMAAEIERLRADRDEALDAARALRQFVSPPLTQSDMDAAIEIARAIRALGKESGS